MQSLVRSSSNGISSNDPDESTEAVSIYRSGTVTPVVEQRCSILLKNAFPNLPAGFYAILHDRVLEHGFTDQRLMDAIKHLIDTFEYPTPAIANIISFDQKVKLYTWIQIANKVDKGDSFSNYKRLKNGRYADRIEAEKYHME